MEAVFADTETPSLPETTEAHAPGRSLMERIRGAIRSSVLLASAFSQGAMAEDSTVPPSPEPQEKKVQQQPEEQKMPRHWKFFPPVFFVGPAAPHMPMLKRVFFPREKYGKLITQTNLQPEQYDNPDPLIQTLREEYFSRMDDPQWRERKAATNEALQTAQAFTNRRSPFSPRIAEALTLDRDQYSLELVKRAELVRNALLGNRHEGYPLTRVPIDDSSTGSDILRSLERQSSMRIRIPDKSASAALETLAMDPQKNSFCEIIKSLCDRTSTKPTINTEEHFLMELVAREENERLVIDHTGLVIGIHKQQEHAGKVLSFEYLSAIADPQIAFIEMTGMTATMRNAVEASIQPTVNPAWVNRGLLAKPDCSESDVHPFNGDRSGGMIAMHVAILAKPVTKDIALGAEEPEWFGRHGVKAQFDQKRFVTTVTTELQKKAFWSYWDGVRTATQQYTLLDAHGEAIPTSVQNVEEVGTERSYTVELKGLRTPFAVRVRLYRYRDSSLYGAKIPPFIFEIPGDEKEEGTLQDVLQKDN